MSERTVDQATPSVQCRASLELCGGEEVVACNREEGHGGNHRGISEVPPTNPEDDGVRTHLWSDREEEDPDEGREIDQQISGRWEK